MHDQLRLILSVARATRTSSLRQALIEAGYSTVCATLDAKDLRPLLRAEPSLIDDWLAYSEDKRTSGGWYILRSGEIGRASQSALSERFASLDEAVAEYVVRELEFWASETSAS